MVADNSTPTNGAVTDTEKLRLRYITALVLCILAVVCYISGQPILGGVLIGFAGVQLPTGDFLNKAGV